MSALFWPTSNENKEQVRYQTWWESCTVLYHSTFKPSTKMREIRASPIDWASYSFLEYYFTNINNLYWSFLRISCILFSGNVRDGGGSTCDHENLWGKLRITGLAYYSERQVLLAPSGILKVMTMIVWYQHYLLNKSFGFETQISGFDNNSYHSLCFIDEFCSVT